jgi:ribosomal protein S25
MTDMSPSELTAKVEKALQTERTVAEVAQYVGCDQSTALNVMLYLAGRGKIELVDSLHKKWAVKQIRKVEA